MKKVQFITQAKGGAGKSVLAFLLAEKYPAAIIADMDDATKTTMAQLAYRNPDLVSFLNENRSIDRGLFSDFFEEIAGSQSKHFICDLGASISEQLPKYISDIQPGNIYSLVADCGIDLEIICVVGGANIFKATMMFLHELVESGGHVLNIKVAVNEFYHLNAEQQNMLSDYTEANELESVPFTISRDTNHSTQDRIRAVLRSGQGLSRANGFSKIHFANAIKVRL